MKNLDVAELFERMAALFDIQGKLVFKVRAYLKAAERSVSWLKTFSLSGTKTGFRKSPALERLWRQRSRNI